MNKIVNHFQKRSFLSTCFYFKKTFCGTALPDANLILNLEKRTKIEIDKKRQTRSTFHLSCQQKNIDTLSTRAFCSLIKPYDVVLIPGLLHADTYRCCSVLLTQAQQVSEHPSLVCLAISSFNLGCSIILPQMSSILLKLSSFLLHISVVLQFFQLLCCSATSSNSPSTSSSIDSYGIG